jgi:hypothetical protein
MRNDQVLAGRVLSLTNTTEQASNVLDLLHLGFTGLGRKQFYDSLGAGFSALRDAAQDTGNTYLSWKYYWRPDIDLAVLNDEQRKRRSEIMRLMELRHDA